MHDGLFLLTCWTHSVELLFVILQNIQDLVTDHARTDRDVYVSDLSHTASDVTLSFHRVSHSPRVVKIL